MLRSTAFERLNPRKRTNFWPPLCLRIIDLRTIVRLTTLVLTGNVGMKNPGHCTRKPGRMTEFVSRGLVYLAQSPASTAFLISRAIRQTKLKTAVAMMEAAKGQPSQRTRKIVPARIAAQEKAHKARMKRKGRVRFMVK